MSIESRTLGTRYELYIPTKVRDNTIEERLVELTRVARGMTATSVQGGYVFPLEPNKVLLEGVVIYTFYAPNDHEVPNQEISDIVARIVSHLLLVKLEDSVLIIADGVPVLYEAD